ncbi:MAG: T9SS type A sorting domain-containing protein, partial [Tannerella sp.]|nr:T9SS type A sorting domain-containing protein [Tannerella sp.]
GTYTATLTVGGDGLTSQSVTVTHTVAPTGIESPQATATKVWAHGGTLYIAASTSGTAYVYNVSGQLVKTLHATSLHGETVSIPLPRGVYVVVVEGKTYKVIIQ